MGAMDRFLEKLYDSTDHCRGSLSGLRDVQERTRVIRRQLEGALGDFGFAHRQPDHLGEQIEHTVLEDHIRERMIFQLGDELSVPVYVLTPRQHSGPLPAVLALHGHGYGSKEIVGLAPDGTADTAATGIHQHFAIQLVRRGMKVFAPELAGFGERRLARDYAEAKPCSCNTLSRHLIMTGRTLAGLRVYEATRMIDLMARLQDVDSERLGLMGFSGGGLVAAYASGLEERIKATVLCGFANTFKHSILAMDHCIDNYVPGVLQIAELPDLIGLIAPRNLFIESGVHDPIFPLAGVHAAIGSLERTYGAWQSLHHFSFDLFEGGHEINGRHAYDWLKQSLNV